jgi:hypothetical protein
LHNNPVIFPLHSFAIEEILGFFGIVGIDFLPDFCFPRLVSWRRVKLWSGNRLCLPGLSLSICGGKDAAGFSLGGGWHVT